MTDTAFLSALQRYVLEPADGGASWGTGLWTRDEVLTAVNETQRAFLARTRLHRGFYELAFDAAQPSVEVGEEILGITHADVFYDGRWTPLPAHSRADLDLALPKWNLQQGRPKAYLEYEYSTTSVTLAPIPALPGRLHLIVLPTPQLITGSNDPLTLDEPWIPFLFAGSLARMFGRPGRAFDAGRRDTFQAVYDLGVTLASALVSDPEG